MDSTVYRGYPIPSGPPPATQDQANPRDQLRALGAAIDADVQSLVGDIAQAQADVLSGLRLLTVVRYTAAGVDSFDKGDYAGLRAIRYRLWGSGGGSGSTAATSGSQVAQAAGGGSGAYVEGILEEGDLATSETVTIGAGGTAGTAGGAGNQGGTTSLGSHGSSTGGGGGASGTATSNTTGNTSRAGGAAGAPTGGDFSLPGNAAQWANVATGSPQRNGDGAPAPGMGNRAISPAPSAAGVAAVGYGGGAAGACAGTSQSALAGAAGAGGLIVIEVYV